MNKKIPEGWKKVRLGEILEYEQPQKYIVESEKYDEEYGIPVLTPGKAFILGYTEESFGIFKDIPIILFDDFTTESKYVTFPFKVKSSAVKILKLKNKKEDVLYVVYNLMQILNFKPGSEHKRFWISEYSKIEVALPPLPEQQKIAEILETVDKVIEQSDKIIEKYKRIKQGLMQDLLTKGIDENWQIRSEETHRFKDSPLGRIPEEWEVVRLGCVGDIIYGEGLRQELYEPDGDTLVFGTGGIIGRAKLFLDRGPALVIPRKGSITSVFYIQEDQKFWVIDTAFYLKPKNGYCKFIYFTLCNMNLELLNEATGVPSLSRENIKSIQIPLPPLPEQKRIASILSQIDEAIEKEQKYKEKLERVKKGLMEDLLMGKVRVNHLIEENKGLEGVENV